MELGHAVSALGRIGTAGAMQALRGREEDEGVRRSLNMPLRSTLRQVTDPVEG